MPDANKENTLNQLVGAAFGAAGQRCMALSTAVFVGDATQWIPDLVERTRKLKVNAGTQHGMISKMIVSNHNAFRFFLELILFRTPSGRGSWTRHLSPGQTKDL